MSTTNALASERHFQPFHLMRDAAHRLRRRYAYSVDHDLAQVRRGEGARLEALREHIDLDDAARGGEAALLAAVRDDELRQARVALLLAGGTKPDRVRVLYGAE
eukprot:3493901-Pleurochrysis_carterae.AAC.3